MDISDFYSMEQDSADRWEDEFLEEVNPMKESKDINEHR